MENLFKIMREKLGSENAAQNEFLKYKLSGLDVLEMTAHELFLEAGKDGWDHLLLNVTVEEFAHLLDNSARKRWARYEKDSAFRKRSRSAVDTQVLSRKKATKTKGETSIKKTASATESPLASRREKPEQLRLLAIDPPPPPMPRSSPLQPTGVSKKIIVFLRSHAWTNANQIASEAGLNKNELAQHISHLLKIGWIKSVHEDGETRYALN